MHILTSVRRLAVIVVICLTACTNVQLVDRYDVAIEKGVNDYHKSVVKFLKDDPEYNTKAAKDFYSTAAANLANIVVRAQVVAISSTCDDPRFIQSISSSVRNAIAASGISISEMPSADVLLQSGSCTVIALKALSANHARLEAMHKRLTRLGTYRAALWSELLGDSVRMALTVEAAKKS